MTPAESETVARCWLIARGDTPRDRLVGKLALLEGAYPRAGTTPEQRAALLAAAVLGGCGLGLLRTPR